MQKTATIALLGLPNAGKSTLINAIIGEKLAAIHAKPQMTRKNLLAIHTEKECQLVFIDTPGLNDHDQLLNNAMRQQLDQALAEADVVLILLEIHRKLDPFLKSVIDKIPPDKTKIIVINKMDLPPKQWFLDPKVLQKEFNTEIFYVSAKEGKGVADLVKTLQKQAPTHPFFYDGEDMTTASMRDLAANCILEKLMQHLHQEIPYQCAVIIEDYKEEPGIAKISALIVVNRKSQKGMVIGKGGASLKKIGTEARLELEKLTQTKVFLQLFVKVDEDWIKNQKKVKDYGGYEG